MELKGTREVMDALKTLDTKLQMSLLKSFNRKALKDRALPIMDSAIISKRAKGNIKIVSERGTKNKSSLLIGPNRNQYWELFLQKGTKNRTSKKGYNRGSVRGDYKLDKAVDQTIDPIIKYSSEEFGKFITKTLESRLRSTNRRIAKIKG